MMRGSLVKVMVRSGGLALLLAFISWPFVVMTLGPMQLSEYRNGHTQDLPLTTLGVWSAAASSVFPAALIAGSLGGIVVRRYWLVGTLLTFLLALIVAIEGSLVLPVLLGQDLGLVCTIGSPPCSPIFVTTDPGSQTLGLVFLPLAPLYEPGPVSVLAIGVAIWSVILRRGPWSRTPPNG